MINRTYYVRYKGFHCERQGWYVINHSSWFAPNVVEIIKSEIPEYETLDILEIKRV